MKKLLLALLLLASPAGANVVSTNVERNGGLSSPVAGDFVWLGDAIFGSSAGAVGAVSINETAGCITFEGSVADAEEANICVTNVTQAGNSRPVIIISNDDSDAGFGATQSAGDSALLQVTSSGTGNRGATIGYFVTSANGPFVNIRKGRGTATSWSAVASSDVLGEIVFQGMVTEGAMNAATLTATAMEGFTLSTVGTKVELKTASLTTATQTIRQIWDSSARVTFGASQDAASSIDVHQTLNCISGEGTVADAFESNICFGDPAADGTVTVTGGVVTGTAFIPAPHLFTIADDGAGTVATGTLNPTSNVVLVTCSDANGCNVTMGESGATSGAVVHITNVSANAANFADTSGVSELTGAIALGQWDGLILVYASDRWAQLSTHSNN